MEETVEVHPSRTIRRFNSHAEQELETRRYWRGRSTVEKFQAVAEMMESFCKMRGIDVHAQGPKRFVVRVQRVRS
jgi:hypothetical protein